MTSQNADTTQADSDGLAGDWSEFRRRSLLKMLSVGGALSAGGGLAAASGDESNHQGTGDEGQGGEGDREDERGDAEIDLRYGFATPDAGDLPEGLDPDHEVELHRVLFDPENPGVPSFFHFEPTGLSVAAGDIVQFTYNSPNHTITAYHPENGFQRRVPKGIPAFSSPIVKEDGAWLYRFEQAGIYDLYCGVHSVLGMVMRVVVGDVSEKDVPDYVGTFKAEPPLFPPIPKAALEQELNVASKQNEDCEWPWLTAPEVLKADALDPMNIQEAGEVSFETVLAQIDRVPDELPDHAAGMAVQVREHPEHGDILVDSEGMTLYMFDKDSQGAGESACTGDCAGAWPPLTVDGKPTAGDNVTAELGTLDRETGETQVTANGWPLYYFVKDEQPGDANGQGVQGFGDAWWILQPDGTPIRSG
ncbi:plastocyanin [Haloarcula sp. JP-L23]|uniref:plastocyanin n=1 Tax=Haloarcula sp. JP-L23 TaxID=2716717 RepID=UPI00140F06FB|nr:plastocyanin [Haloarcula sp. JP-L23]